MFSRGLMIASALFLGALGVILSFMPEEFLSFFGLDILPLTVLIMQLAGSLYLALAILNWMSKNSLIGGIYSRPLLIANLVHFMVSSITIVKFSVQILNSSLLILASIYILFTFTFIYAFMTNPAKNDFNFEEID